METTELSADAPELATATAEAPVKSNKLPEIPIAQVAVVTCLEDLQRVLADHQKWAEAVLDPNTEVASGRANLTNADLRGYELAGVNLSGANLSGANLAGCDLEGANLSVANLQGAVLACTNLRGAKLRRARLEGADLRGADLTNANLTGVDLSKTLMKTPEKAEDSAKTAAPIKPEHSEPEHSEPEHIEAAAPEEAEDETTAVGSLPDEPLVSGNVVL